MMKPTGFGNRDVGVSFQLRSLCGLRQVANFSRSQFLYQQDGDDDNNSSVQSGYFED